MEGIASANFHTLSVNESTNIFVSKCLILYFKYRVSFEYKTRFGEIIQLKSCEASSIVTAIEKFYKKYRLEMHKMVMFTSDGATVILGRRNGVAVKLKERIPHLVQQHCIAHWEDSGIADRWKEMKLLQDIETLMRTIYFISCSTTNSCKCQDIATACANEAIAFKPLNKVRWLSCHFALQAIIKNYDSLIAYFEEMKPNNPISKYCLKKLKNNGVYIALEVLNDVFEKLAALCKIFQRQGLTPIDAQNFSHAKINKLRQKYLGDMTFWGEKVDNLLARISEEETATFDIEGLLNFIRLLCDHMVERFPEGEVQDWVAFDYAALKFPCYAFGMTQIETLWSKYQPVLPERNIIIKQYTDFKCAITEKIKAGIVSTFADLINFRFQHEQFRDLAKLTDIGGTFLASSVECEHGFSLMNSIKIKLRNRLGEGYLDMITRVKSYQRHGCVIDKVKVYEEWVSSKDRREKFV